VSTGHLPLPERVRQLLYEAHERFAAVDEGQNADYYPALATVPRELFGICLAGTDGPSYAVGDAQHPFTIMSISKPFVFALVCQVYGPEASRAKLGVNATGFPFNSVVAFELNENRLTNPMVNPGALATTSLVPGDTAAEKWQCIRDGLSRFAGRTLAVNEEVYASASASNHRNRGIASLLHG
jgi:glutaminase